MCRILDTGLCSILGYNRPDRETRRDAVAAHNARRNRATVEQVARARCRKAHAPEGCGARPAGAGRERDRCDRRDRIGRDRESARRAGDGHARVAGVRDLTGDLRARLAGVGRVQTKVHAAGHGRSAQPGRVAQVRDIRILENREKQRIFKCVGLADGRILSITAL